MKILVFQFDSRKDNENINLMLERNKEYCRLNGYDYVFDNFDPLSVHHDFEDLTIDENIFNLNLYFHRFEMFEKYIDDYDYVVSLDSDVIVNNPFIKIENLIDDTHDLFISQDTNFLAATIHINASSQAIQNFCKENNVNFLTNPEENLKRIKIWEFSIFHSLFTVCTNPNGYNCGFIILKKSNIIKQFIKDFKKYYIIFDDATYDQGCVGLLLQKKKYKNIVKLLPFGIQGNPFSTIPGYNEDHNFLCHFYGSGSKNFEETKKWCNIIKSNKWWSQIK